MGDEAHTLILTTDLKMRVVFYESFPLLRQSLTAGMSAFITDCESNEDLVWMSSAGLTVFGFAARLDTPVLMNTRVGRRKCNKRLVRLVSLQEEGREVESKESEET